MYIARDRGLTIVYTISCLIIQALSVIGYIMYLMHLYVLGAHETHAIILPRWRGGGEIARIAEKLQEGAGLADTGHRACGPR